MQYVAPTQLNAQAPRKIEHMTQIEWDALTKAQKDKYDREVIGKKPPTVRAIAAEIPNRDPITVIEWVATFVLFVGFLFTSTKVAAAAIPYANGVLESMTHGEGVVSEPVRIFFTLTVALFFILLATPSVIFFKIVDHTPQTAAAKKKTAIDIDRWPNGFNEWVVFFPLLFLRLLSLDWLTPRLPLVITYVSIGWLIYISISGGGNIFEMVIPILVEVGLAQTVASILEKTAAYRVLVLDAWEQRLKRWKQRKQGFMADSKYLEMLHGAVRDKLIGKVIQGQRPNAWLVEADPQIVDDVILAEFRRFTGGQAFGQRVQELDYTKSAQAGEALVPPNGAKAWTAETLYRSIQQRGITGSYTRSNVMADYAAGYEAAKAWSSGAKSMYEAGGK